MSTNVSDIYGSLVFNEHVMAERLPSVTYKALMRTIEKGDPLDIEVANVVAHSMKEWAIEHGATHYTHWFQPLTGLTSEKHDSFLDPIRDGRALMRFNGKELIQGEPDASSFPNGGLRATFEARGYTAWDPTSYAFIKDEVLCIPTAFCSYTGEALDEKTPLLRSMAVIEEQANRVLALFGEKRRRIDVTVGCEQEYFLISEEQYKKRLDLMLTNRTLFGYAPCKGQELDDHYFGAIRPTVNEFMKELDDELWKIGVPAKTKHNEVAPAQHELAPIFENANRAIDHNLLTMEKMRLIASHHGLVCLQHEKPFAGINGSGKHDNWSLAANGRNLLEPGENPMENLRFLVFLTCVIEAVDEYQELLRASTASAGNDQRLGADEAPPAIVSIFLGTELSGMVDALVNDHESEFESADKVAMDLGVSVLPAFLIDNTDRNRTSPFAFTGNKFEFRMPGSSQNLSETNTILNAAVSKSLKDFADAMDGLTGEAFEKAALAHIKELLKDHARIIFDGNGYSEEWEAEAARRGLPNLRTTAEAMPALISKKCIDLFEEFGILTEAEVRSRYEVKLEKYNKLINIEARTCKRMVRQLYLPAIADYAAEVAANIGKVKAVAPDADLSPQETILGKLNRGIKAIDDLLIELDETHHRVRAIPDQQECANENASKVVPLMNALRAEVDALEIVVSADHWPVPSYNDILFYA
ncbi:MAG: glutamine synthetase III [Eggerthellaceae bacterium]|nr:glutamine synthetase III [Eggerthellaceae bacterium]